MTIYLLSLFFSEHLWLSRTCIHKSSAWSCAQSPVYAVCVSLSLSLSLSLCVPLSLCVCVSLPLSLCVCVCVCVCVCLSLSLSVCPSLSLCVCVSLPLSLSLSLSLSVCACVRVVTRWWWTGVMSLSEELGWGPSAGNLSLLSAEPPGTSRRCDAGFLPKQGPIFHIHILISIPDDCVYIYIYIYRSIYIYIQVHLRKLDFLKNVFLLLI